MELSTHSWFCTGGYHFHWYWGLFRWGQVALWSAGALSMVDSWDIGNNVITWQTGNKKLILGRILGNVATGELVSPGGYGWGVIDPWHNSTFSPFGCLNSKPTSRKVSNKAVCSSKQKAVLGKATTKRLGSPKYHKPSARERARKICFNHAFLFCFASYESCDGFQLHIHILSTYSCLLHFA